MSSPDTGTRDWERIGDVMCEGIASHDEAVMLHAEVADQEQRLARLLALTDSILKQSGVAERVVAMDRFTHRQAFTAAKEDIAQTYGVYVDDRAEEDCGPIKVDPSTQFRVAEGIFEDEPCDPSQLVRPLYVVIYNGPEANERSVVEIGTRIAGEFCEDDAFSTALSLPSELWLPEEEVALVGSRIDAMKEEMASDRLPDLGKNGYYDTLVVQGSLAA